MSRPQTHRHYDEWPGVEETAASTARSWWVQHHLYCLATLSSIVCSIKPGGKCCCANAWHVTSPSYAGIDLLNISLDTLDPHKFEIMTRRRGHKRVVDAIDRAVQLGYSPVKVCSSSPLIRLAP